MTPEKQQTPLHKAITTFKNCGATALSVNEVIQNLESLLPEEKQVVIDAHKDGMSTVDCLPEYSEQYFNETFEQ